jgi:probable F420-dependent oxidoreductase
MHPTLERLRGAVGVWTITHEGVRPRELGEFAQRLEDAGVDVLWTPEAYGREAMTGAQLVLERSSRLAVATGIASIYARDAMATAAASRSLADAFEGRFVLGLGVSHRPLVERARGGSYGPPIGAMTSYLDALDGAMVTSAEAEARAPVVLAALGPRMLGLAGLRTDGALTYLVTPAHTADARAALGPDGFLAVEQSVVVGHDREEYLRRAHEHLGWYTGLDNYRASWRRLGFTDDDFVRGGSERLCEAIVVHGDVDDVAERVDEHRRAGADHVCLQALGAHALEAPWAMWAELGPRLTRS